MKWYRLLYGELTGLINEIDCWGSVFVYLIAIPILAPIVAVCFFGAGLVGLVKLTLDPETYECFGEALQTVAMALVLCFYLIVGGVCCLGTYAYAAHLLERFLG